MDEKKKRLEESKSFCILPWTHMHIMPDGKALPCCISDNNFSYGDANSQTISEIWNGENMRKMRRELLQDIEQPQCKMCYKREADTGGSFRIKYNKEFKHHYDVVESTLEDGTVEKVNMVYIDFRLSNICNFKCRICGHHYSSSWFHDQMKFRGSTDYDSQIVRVTDHNKSFWQDVEDNVIDTIEEVYFAGGEPLIMPEHYKILDLLLKYNKHDVKIWYNTNFSQFSYKNLNIIDYWQKFKNVRVQASLDASKERGEYLRKGQSWDQVLRNRELMLEKTPHVEFEISSTIMNMNVWHVPDFWQEWVDLGFVENNKWNFNPLYGPHYYKCGVLPQSLHSETIQKWKEFSEKTKDITRTHKNCNGVLNVLELWEPYHIQDFIDKNGLLDKIRDENFLEIFPELSEFINYV